MDSKLNKPSSLENSFKTSGEEVERVGRGDFMRDLGEQKRGKTSEVERADCESLVGGSNYYYYSSPINTKYCRSLRITWPQYLH